MYIILVYDIEQERIDKVNKFLKRYLYWIQNSVFEGELTESQFVIMKDKLKHLIDENRDSVIIYKLNWEKAITREIMGIEKSSTDNII